MKTEIKKIKIELDLLKIKAIQRKWTDDNNGVETMFSIDGLGHYIADIEDALDRDDAIRMLAE